MHYRSPAGLLRPSGRQGERTKSGAQDRSARTYSPPLCRWRGGRQPSSPISKPSNPPASSTEPPRLLPSGNARPSSRRPQELPPNVHNLLQPSRHNTAIAAQRVQQPRVPPQRQRSGRLRQRCAKARDIRNGQLPRLQVDLPEHLFWRVLGPRIDAPGDRRRQPSDCPPTSYQVGGVLPIFACHGRGDGTDDRPDDCASDAVRRVGLRSGVHRGCSLSYGVEPAPPLQAPRPRWSKHAPWRTGDSTGASSAARCAWVAAK
jgi:hypothetical protein